MGIVSALLLSYKMRPSIVCLPILSLLLVLLQVPGDEGTFALSITSAAGVSLLSLTAAQVSTIAALGVLAKLGGLGAGLLLSRRGKRQAGQEGELISWSSSGWLRTISVEGHWSSSSPPC